MNLIFELNWDILFSRFYRVIKLKIHELLFYEIGLIE